MSKNEIVKYQCKCGKMKSPYAMAPLVGTCRYCLTQCDKLIKKHKGTHMDDTLKDKYSLPKEFKEAWIKALKSGNYRQGAGALRRENEQLIDKPEYCCLGVACSVAGVPEEYISGEWIERQYDLELYEFSEVPEILHGGSDDNELVEVLSTMNDSHTRDTSEHKFSFEDIADWIDDNIKAIDGDS